jgi:hypothetical protein
VTQPVQDWLLQAAFLQGEACRQAWSAWRSSFDPDSPLDPGSFRLLPLVYRNLHKQSQTDPLLSKFKGISHQNWSRNQLFLQEMGPFLSNLYQSGITVCALGGMSLMLQGFSDLFLYPPNTCSLLVKPEQALATIQMIRECRWNPVSNMLSDLDERHLRSTNGLGFVSPAGRRLEVLWRLPGIFGVSPFTDWFDRRPYQPINGIVQVYLPDPELQFILTFIPVHYPIRPSFFLQAVELMLILEMVGKRLDWVGLATCIQEIGLTAQAQSMIRYLCQVLELESRIPQTRCILNLKAPLIGRIQHHFSLQRLASLDCYPYGWIDFLNRNFSQTRSEKLVGFIRLVVRSWQMEYIWQAPWFLLATLLFRLGLR